MSTVNIFINQIQKHTSLFQSLFTEYCLLSCWDNCQLYTLRLSCLGPHLWEDIFLSVSVQSEPLELTYRQESPQLSQTFHSRGWNAEQQNSLTELLCGSNNPHLTMVNETFVIPQFLMRMLRTHHFFQVFTQTVKAFTDIKRSYLFSVNW